MQSGKTCKRGTLSGKRSTRRKLRCQNKITNKRGYEKTEHSIVVNLPCRILTTKKLNVVAKGLSFAPTLHCNIF